MLRYVPPYVIGVLESHGSLTGARREVVLHIEQNPLSLGASQYPNGCLSLFMLFKSNAHEYRNLMCLLGAANIHA